MTPREDTMRDTLKLRKSIISKEHLLIEMDQKHVGARNELYATIWLLEHGYEVFRNISAFGPVDIIGMKDNKIELFDVKAGLGHCYYSYSTPLQKELGVRTLIVMENGECKMADNELIPENLARNRQARAARGGRPARGYHGST
jgi:hypothetical protein